MSKRKKKSEKTPETEEQASDSGLQGTATDGSLNPEAEAQEPDSEESESQSNSDTPPASEESDSEESESQSNSDTPPETEESDSEEQEPKAIQEPQRELAEGEFLLRLTKPAALGNGNREAGETLGTCRCAPDVSEQEILEAVRDPRWTLETPHEGGGVVLVIKRQKEQRKIGEEIALIKPDEGYTIRECMNALRNSRLLGR